ncbi:MAG: Imm50 family immunity protein [Candidatus Thiothrix putei]|uniref:Imm50 family immunity protein n=1 Tax=Candidatus Thiothrix putei TaxID=3080811 RepID=A0AA95KL89_9GAMM|nr:MAG: Imm50 family immunity protein [Candidatus Thiothrix putei]
MTNWISFLSDDAMLRAIFGDELPTLQQVDIHEVVLHWDGSRVLLRFDLAEFPKSPPKKWKASGFNRVQLKLLAVGIHDFSIEGWCSQCRCSIRVFSAGKTIGLQTEEGKVKIMLTTDFLLLDGISAYHDQL